MRLLHTSDWHLGHTLRDIPRDGEHERFLRWLLDVIAAEKIDSLLIAGDVFHTANPPATAQAAWYGFLAEARRRFPALDVVVIGGNHDSAARLDAPVPLLDAMRIHVVGGLPRRADGTIDADRLVVPLTDRVGNVVGHVLAVPYLRRADLPVVEEEGRDPLIEGVRRVYADVMAAAKKKKWPGHFLVGMGHLYMTGTALSEMSERKILGGHQHALPVDIFPESLAYVALGHLHLAQAVGRESVRYAGSPLPLSMGEAGYQHQVVVVDIDGERLTGVRPLQVPRTVDLIRLPEGGPRGIEDVLLRLRQIPPIGDGPLPYLEVSVRVDRPDPSLRRRIEEALEGRHARLVQIAVERIGGDDALGDALPEHDLQDLDPAEVFARKYERDHGNPPPDDLLAAFHELADALRSEVAA
jgi:exonuclease SbcD